MDGASIDFRVAATIAAPILALLVGAFLNRRLERRPRIMSYYGHVSSFTVRPATGMPLLIHMHSVIIRNNGSKAATNLRVSHLVLPDFNIYPAVPYTVETTPGGLTDFVFPIVVPKEEITISYMYPPPTVVTDVNNGIRHDDGFATAIPVLLQRQYSPMISNLAMAVFTLGFIALAYLAWEILRWIYSRL